MKNILFVLAALVLLLSLAGCGKFEIEGELVSESDTVTITEAEIDQNVGSGEGQIAASNSPTFSLGLIEVGLIFGVLVLAGVAVGAFFIMRDRTPKSDYPPSVGEGEDKSIGRLLRFRPSVGALILALSGWAGLFGLVAVLLIFTFLVPVSSTTETWTPTLTKPSSILIGEVLHEDHIRFIPKDEDCTLQFVSDQDQQLICNVQFEGGALAVDVELTEGMFWQCEAAYKGEAVPCRASFNNTDKDTYIIVGSDLGLGQARFQELVEETRNAGWGENDWIWLSRGIVGIISLIIFAFLWRHTGKRIEGRAASAFVMRLIYAGGISLMFFVIVSFLSFGLLLALNLID